MNLTTFVTASIALTIQKYADKYREKDLNLTLQELEEDMSLPNIKSFDFIVVGGGAAGCLLAGRLSEHFTVLLLESGGDPVPATYNPFHNRDVASHPAINYLYPSIRQANFAQESGGVVISDTGRMLGGTWSHNSFVYNRGSPHDYDHFANLTGDGSWSYRKLLQHFKTIENFHGRLLNEGQRNKYYSNTGPLHVETDWFPLVDAWLRSGEEVGFNIGDPNGHQREGFSPQVKSIKNGERVSTYTTFVKPIESTRNSKLKLLRYSDVQTILIDSNNRAYGVTYLRHGIPQIAHAAKEVLICAGTFSSPLLLHRSGIGPKEVLTKAGIPIKKDLPGVGQNFRNHPELSLVFNIGQPDWKLFSRLEESQVEKELNLYQGKERGGFFTEMDFSPQAFIVSRVAKSRGESTWSDIRLMLNRHPSLDGATSWTSSLGISLTRGQSAGEIGFNTTAFLAGEVDDVKLALVDHRQFTVKDDVDVMIEGIKLGLRVMEETSTVRGMNMSWRYDPPAACGNLVPRSDAYWRCAITERAHLAHHFAGTCKMGRDSDPLAVVDAKLRVRGIQNLRVVDASIMPRPNNANTAAPVMVISEKTVQELRTMYLVRGDETTLA